MGEPISVLVCGGRDYADHDAVARDLDKIHARRAIGLLITGDASGADAIARRWAFDRGIGAVVFEADWRKHGRAAGPLRNQEMLDQRPDFVVAFPGGRGTADMVRRANRSGVRVIAAGL